MCCAFCTVLPSWVPYTLAIVYLAPKVGSHRAILASLGIFFILAPAYIAVVNRLKLFQ